MLQFLKHAHKALRIKTGLGMHIETQTIGLALHIARKIQLALRRTGGAAHHHRASSIRASAGGQHAQDHAGNQKRGGAPLLVLHAGDVALGNVAEFMCHHRGQLVAARDHRDQTKVHAHETAWQSKRVDRPVAHQKHIPRKGFFLLGLQSSQLHGRVAQRLPNGLQIVQ